MNKGKLSYSPSKNEFILLCSFLIVLILALSVTYLILPAWDNFTVTMQGFQDQQFKTESLKTEFAAINTYREKEAKAAAELEGLHTSIPAYLSQEEIIVSLDDASAESDLELKGLTFEKTTIEPQDSFLARLQLSSSKDATVPAKETAATQPETDAAQPEAGSC